MSDSRLQPTLDLDGMATEDAFAALGNEIRVRILRTLWQVDAMRRYDDANEAEKTITFSELRRRVDIEDNGQFNYHLSELVPEFVRQTEEGYRLSGAGKEIARTVVAVSATDDVELSTAIPQDCPLCSASMRLVYEDQWLQIQCTECAGLFGDRMPDGAVYFAHYPVGGLSDWPPEQSLEKGLHRCLLDNVHLMRGLCPECGGRVSGSVTLHDETAGIQSPGGDAQFRAWAERRCETCRFAKSLPVELFVIGTTPAIGFLDTLGIDALALPWGEFLDLLDHRTETTIDTDPLRVSVTFEGNEDALCVTVDESMTVCDVAHPS